MDWFNKRGQAGGALDDYLGMLKGCPRLDPEQVRQLIAVARDESRPQAERMAARDRMIEANLRLVVHIARRYAHCGVPLEELVSEGNFGLFRAVDRYDPDKETTFAYYASYWIRTAIRSGLARMMHRLPLPHQFSALIPRYLEASDALQVAGGRHPEAEEVAERSGIEVDKARLVASVCRFSARPGGSLATRGSGDPDSLPGSVPEPWAIMESREAVLRVGQVLQRMPERYATVLRLRHGLDGLPPRQLDEVGRLLGLTRERIRQIQAMAEEMFRALFAGEPYAVAAAGARNVDRRRPSRPARVAEGVAK